MLEPTAAEDRAWQRRRRAAVVAGCAALLVLAGVALREPPTRTLLGQLDADAVLGDVAEPGALEAVAWRTPLAQPPAGGERRPLARTASAGAVAVRDGPVVRVADGRATRAVGPGFPTRSGFEPVLEDGELVLLDGATGRVVRRDALPGSGSQRPVELVGWGNEGLLALDGEGRLLLMTLDGELRWRAPAGLVPPPTGTVARGHLMLTTTATGGRDLVVLDLFSGELGAWSARAGAMQQPQAVKLPDGPSLVLAVVDGTVTAWSLPTGRVLWTVELGTGGDVVLADQDEVLAALVIAEDGTSEVVRLDPDRGNVMTRFTGPVVPDGSRGDGLWDVDLRGGAVVAAEGVTLTPWRRDARLLPALGVGEVALAGGVVALGRDGPDGTAIVQLRDRGDGAVVGEVPAGPRAPLRPVGVAGDHIALTSAQDRATAVDQLQWVRLGDGRSEDADAALRPLLGTAELADVHLLGATRDGAPVLARAAAQGPLSLLDRDGDLTVEVALRDPGRVPRAVGVVDGRLVLARPDAAPRGLLVDLAGAGTQVLARLAPVAATEAGVLALAGDGRIVAVGDSARGQRVGPLAGAAAQRFAGTAVAVGDVVVGQAGDRALVAVDAASATVLWRTTPPVATLAGPLAWRERVVHVGVDGVLRVDDAADGGELWTQGGPTDAVLSAAVAGDVVVVGTADGRLRVLDLAGRLRDEIDLGTGPVRAVAVVDGRVVATVGTTVLAAGPRGSSR